MKIINFIIVLILSYSSSWSQRTVTYHYILNSHIGVTDSIIPLFDMGQEFITVRRYYSSSTFSETKLLTGDNHKSILYKTENGIWYYKHKNRWRLFYNYHKMVGGNIVLFGLKYKITFLNSINIRNIVLHKIFLDPINVHQSHRLVYYFNPLKGFIIIQSSNGSTLLRSDAFDESLTDEEINLL